MIVSKIGINKKPIKLLAFYGLSEKVRVVVVLGFAVGVWQVCNIHLYD